MTEVTAEDFQAPPGFRIEAGKRYADLLGNVRIVVEREGRFFDRAYQIGFNADGTPNTHVSHLYRLVVEVPPSGPLSYYATVQEVVEQRRAFTVAEVRARVKNRT